MQKDVIYIDVEDDITAIIGKVKESNSKIVALVPPKRIGAIQSAVNLKLVHRAAEQADKRLVIISNNSALMALAGSAGIPTAKNLQSKPELPEISALEVDEGEDIIDGAELPVGDHAKQAREPSDDAASSTPLTPLEGDVPKVASVAAVGATATKGAAVRSKTKVPNFNTFRKKLFLIGGGVLALIIFLVWALAFAPRANVIITAKTSDAALNSRVSFGPSLNTDLKDGSIKAETKTLKKDIAIPFTATGKKDVGEKATGSVTFSTGAIDNLGTTIPAGTSLRSTSGATYVTDRDVTITITNYRGATTGITATASGANYNGATGSMTGAPSGISATISDATAGGTDKTITVVDQADVDGVVDQADKQSDAEAAKKELKAQFKGDYFIIDATFKADKGDMKATPAVGQEAAEGKGTYGGAVTYSLTAVPKSEAKEYLDEYFASQIDGKQNQKVYNSGIKNVNFTNISGAENGFTANISTNGKIGPKIDEATMKEFAKGKEYGEIQSEVQSIDGVQSADVKFSPFWVSKAPNDTKKISIEFKVDGE